MAVYNTNFKLIKRAIDSVLKQDFQNFELIIIDDGSHKVSHQLKSLNLLWDKVLSEGLYIIEDIHTSFFNEYVDFNPTTFQVLKDLKKSILHDSVEAICPLNRIMNELYSVNFFSKYSDIQTDSNTCVLQKK